MNGSFFLLTIYSPRIWSARVPQDGHQIQMEITFFIILQSSYKHIIHCQKWRFSCSLKEDDEEEGRLFGECNIFSGHLIFIFYHPLTTLQQNVNPFNIAIVGVQGTIHKQPLEALEKLKIPPWEIKKLIKHIHQIAIKYLT